MPKAQEIDAGLLRFLLREVGVAANMEIIGGTNVFSSPSPLSTRPPTALQSHQAE